MTDAVQTVQNPAYRGSAFFFLILHIIRYHYGYSRRQKSDLLDGGREQVTASVFPTAATESVADKVALSGVKPMLLIYDQSDAP